MQPNIAFVRPWHMHWGATSDEITQAMPGDSLVEGPLEALRAEPHSAKSGHRSRNHPSLI
jgi:hypothetical protein